MQKFSDTVSTLDGSAVVVLSSATVSVYAAGTETYATIYSSNSRTPLSNPFLTSDIGLLEFYAEDGRYDIHIDKAGYNSIVLADVLLEDPADRTDDDIAGVVVDDCDITNSRLSNCTIENVDIAALPFDSIDFSTTPSATAPRRLSWNADEDTLDLGLNGGGVTLQLGQEMYYHVVNKSGATIPDGTVVMSSGTVGGSGKITIAPFIANGTLPSKYMMGVATQTLANNGNGYVTAFGKVRGVDTTGIPFGENWGDGDILYASATTPGALTKVPPVAPNNRITVAIVINASANGTLFVRPTYGSSLADDEKVILGTLANGDTLQYDSISGVFRNQPPRAGAPAPASASATGVAGQIAYDADYLYICVATNTWKRVALSTWA